jgi:hypothetical protein
MADVTINNQVFSSQSVECFWYGQTLLGLREINFEETQENKGVKVVGNREHAGYTIGNNTYSGDITILEADYNALKLAAGGKISNLKPAPLVIVTVANGLVNKETVLCKPAGQGRQVSADSADELARRIPLFVLSIT